MKASQLRFVLVGMIVLVVGGFGAAVYFLNDLLAKASADTAHARLDQELSETNISNLIQLEKTLEENDELSDKVSKLLASPEKAQYQDQVVEDVKAYGARNGITIAGISFTEKTSKSKVKTPAGTSIAAATISMRGAIEYRKFMNFVYDLESNLPKMRLTNLAITPSSDDPSRIQNPTLNIEVYLKG